MTKEEMEIELRKCLSTLISGTPDEFRNAKKEIERLWHQNHVEFKDAALVALEYLPLFDTIKKAQNQAAFISGLSLFFLILGDEYFDTLKNFTLNAFQHPNGSIRQAMRNTAEWLYISLTARINPYTYPKGKKLTEKQKFEQKQAKIQFISLVKEIESLLNEYHDENENVQYVDEMKPSIDKTLQFFWSRLMEGSTYKKIIDQIRPVPFEIVKKRKETESKLLEILKKTRSRSTLKNIKEIIYNEDSHNILTNVITMFDTDQGNIRIEDILEIVNDAWNYFPHKVLEGLSPAEKFLEYQQIQQKIHRS